MPSVISKSLSKEHGVPKLSCRPPGEADALLASACLSVFRPRRHGSIADWISAQKIRITSEQNSALAGSYFDPD